MGMGVKRVDDGPEEITVLAPVDLLRLRVYAAEMDTAAVQLRLEQRNLDVFNFRMREEQRELQAKISEAACALSAAKKAYSEQRATIEAEYDVDLNKQAVDTETGAVTYLEG